MDPIYNKLFDSLVNIFPNEEKRVYGRVIREHKEPKAFSERITIECLMTESGIGSFIIMDANGKYIGKKMFEEKDAADLRKLFAEIKESAVKQVVEGKVTVTDKGPADTEKELVEDAPAPDVAPVTDAPATDAPIAEEPATCAQITDEEVDAIIAANPELAAMDKEQARMGVRVETEHCASVNGDKTLVAKIALDHLKEIPDYYTRLKAMEDAAKAELAPAPEAVPAEVPAPVENVPAQECKDDKKKMKMKKGKKNESKLDEEIEVTVSSDDKEIKVTDNGNKVKVTQKGEPAPEEKEEAPEEAPKAVPDEAAVPEQETVPPAPPAEAPVESKKDERVELRKKLEEMKDFDKSLLEGVDDKQLDDLLGFVKWAMDNGMDAGYIMSNIVHDLSGLKNKDTGFSPRTSGYAKHLGESKLVEEYPRCKDKAEDIKKIGQKAGLSTKQIEILVKFMTDRFSHSAYDPSYTEEWADRIKSGNAWGAADHISRDALVKAGYQAPAKEAKEEKAVLEPKAGEVEGKKVEKEAAQMEKDIKKADEVMNKDIRAEVKKDQEASMPEGKVAVTDKGAADTEKELLEAIELRPFTDDDYLGLAGAEAPEGGTPMIGEIKVDGVDKMIIVDKNGISIIGEDASELRKEVAFEEGKEAVEVMKPEITGEELKTLGFANIMGESKIKKAKESKEDIAETYTQVAASGISDKAIADRIALEKKGKVVADADDPKKYMVVIPGSK